MIVSVYAADLALIWEYEKDKNGSRGITLAHPPVLRQVIAALRAALEQAEGQLGGAFEVIDIVTNVRAATAEINRDIPIIAMWDDDASGQHTVKPSIVTVPASALVVAEINIVHHADVALMRAGDNDNIARL